MLTYLFFSLFVIALLFAIYFTNLNLFRFFLLASLFLFSGLRFYVGTDFPAYVDYFERMDVGLIYFQGKEIGFTFLNYITKFVLGLNFQSIFLFSSMITIFFIDQSLKALKNRYIYVFGMFIFIFSGFYTQSFNIVRQSLAMAIGLYSLKYVKFNNSYKFYSCVLVASLFHMTSLLLLPLYFLVRIDFNRKMLLFGLIFAFTLSDYVLKFIYLALDTVDARYVFFFEQGADNETSGSGLMQITSFSLCLLAIYYKKLIDRSFFVYFYSFYLFCFFNIVFFDFMLGIRAVQVFKISMLIFVPYLFLLLKGNYKYIIVILCALYLLGFYKYLDGSTNIIPYNISIEL